MAATRLEPGAGAVVRLELEDGYRFRTDLGEGRLGRCLELFEDCCVVTGSVRGGLEVDVAVTPEPAVPR